jgi:hypothetical protein
VSNYDLVVVGAGLGGLAAASLAAKAGKKVLVLDTGERPGGVLAGIRKKDFLFYPGPFLSFGVDRDGPLQQLVESLGISQAAALRSPCYQVALPDRRITVFTEQAETLEELRREFPREIDTIARFYRNLHKVAVGSTRSRLKQFLTRLRRASEFLGPYRFSPEFTAFLNVQSFYFFHRPITALNLRSLVVLCDVPPFTLTRGFGHLAEEMANVLVKAGGEITMGQDLSQISVGPHQVILGRNQIDCRNILLNTEQRERIVACVGVRDEVMPVGMETEVLEVPGYDLQEQFMTISASRRAEDIQAPKGMRAITAVLRRSRKDQSTETVAARLRDIIPFLDDFVVFKEESVHASRPHAFAGRVKGRPTTLLRKTSVKGVFVLPDGASATESVVAARSFVQKLKS